MELRYTVDSFTLSYWTLIKNKPNYARHFGFLSHGDLDYDKGISFFRWKIYRPKHIKNRSNGIKITKHEPFKI